MLDYATVLRSPPFKVLVGKDKVCFNVPTTIAKDLSQPIYAMMSGSEMKEAQKGLAVMEEVENETFAAFCEFAFREDYSVPRVTIESSQSLLKATARRSGSVSPVREDTTREEVPTFEDTPEHPAEDWGSYRLKPKKAKMRPIVPRHESRSETMKEHYGFLWKDFLNFDYAAASVVLSVEDKNIIPEIGFKPLLFHAKVYIFAHMYLIPSLEQLTLQKLHRTLEDEFEHPSAEKCDQVNEVLEFVFANTERHEDGGNDKLRQLLVAYTVAKMDLLLSQNLKFTEILDVYGELGSDIVRALA